MTLPADKEVIDADAVMNGSRIRGLHLTVLVLGALVLFVDGFDTQVIGYITPQLAKNWDIPRAMLGPIFSSGLVGLLVGYLLLAPLSGRFGHKRLVIAAVASFGALTYLTASASTTEMLIICRFLTGIGLGAAIPSAVALTGEYCPQRCRSTFITFMYVGLSAGQMAAGGVSALLLARFGWQSVLWVGGALPLLLAVTLAFALPESLEYLVSRGRDRPLVARLLRRIDPRLRIPHRVMFVAGERGRRSTSIAELLRSRRAAGTIAIWVALFMNLMINFFVQNWLPTILIRVGLSQEAAITTTALSMGGGILAAFIIGPLMDRFGPYKVMAGLFVGGAVFLGLIGVTIAATVVVALVLAANFCAAFCNSGVQKGANALCIFFYPTALRSTGLGWGLGIGRVGAIIGPLAAGAMLDWNWPPATLFYVAALPMLVGAIAMAAMGSFYHGGRAEALAANSAAALPRGEVAGRSSS